MKKRQSGFSLIELMTVVAIIAILVAVAASVYQNLIVKSAERACTAELKAFSNDFFLAVQDGATTVPQPANQACLSTNPATVTSASTTIVGTPQSPGRAVAGQTSCDLSSATCTAPTGP